MPQTAERYNGLCKPCYKRLNPSKKSYPIENYDLEWELSPENAHPIAKENLEEEFFWDICNDYSPLGNDTGADVLHHYRKWRKSNPSTNSNVFLKQILSQVGNRKQKLGFVGRHETTKRAS